MTFTLVKIEQKMHKYIASVSVRVSKPSYQGVTHTSFSLQTTVGFTRRVLARYDYTETGSGSKFNLDLSVLSLCMFQHI